MMRTCATLFVKVFYYIIFVDIIYRIVIAYFTYKLMFTCDCKRDGCRFGPVRGKETLNNFYYLALVTW